MVHMFIPVVPGTIYESLLGILQIFFHSFHTMILPNKPKSDDFIVAGYLDYYIKGNLARR